MCGIIFVKNKRDSEKVNSIARLLYEQQKDRGTEGYGFIGYNKDEFYLTKNTSEKEFLATLQTKFYDEILIHHRQPTSTGNYIESCHPFKVVRGDKTFFLAHNGIIVNSHALHSKHLKNKDIYESEKEGKFNDSEALAIEFANYIEKGEKFEAVGSIAFICLEQDKDQNAKRLYFFANGQANLTFWLTGEMFAIASQSLPSEVKQDRVYFYDYADKVIKKHSKLKGTTFDYEFETGFSSWRYDKDSTEKYYSTHYDYNEKDDEFEWELKVLTEQLKQARARGDEREIKRLVEDIEIYTGESLDEYFKGEPIAIQQESKLPI